MTKLQLQNLDHTLKPCAQSPNKILTLWPNFTFQICTKLLKTRFSSSTSTTVITSTSFELPSSHARVTSIKFSKHEWVSQLVSQWVTDKHSQWSDSGPIKIMRMVWLKSPCNQMVIGWLGGDFLFLKTNEDMVWLVADDFFIIFKYSFIFNPFFIHLSFFSKQVTVWVVLVEVIFLSSLFYSFIFSLKSCQNFGWLCANDFLLSFIIFFLFIHLF